MFNLFSACCSTSKVATPKVVVVERRVDRPEPKAAHEQLRLPEVVAQPIGDDEVCVCVPRGISKASTAASPRIGECWSSGDSMDESPRSSDLVAGEAGHPVVSYFRMARRDAAAGGQCRGLSTWSGWTEAELVAEEELACSCQGTSATSSAATWSGAAEAAAQFIAPWAGGRGTVKRERLSRVAAPPAGGKRGELVVHGASAAFEVMNSV
eukprot:CAMPEP_0176181348 /NCGR_PEP_ID=MMETSP0120_2-20121206/92920_1 /TAXON_ID=160619 /ORGANISM="Kryptoperidinium foliaceum, Strain CCMP 1326" /LENGTH=209 /DNA_ID=CAMNT_0017519573 /DNA_START=60 /DNA_END=687 /DNA_ORIENTATION=+